ncbi:WD40 repeat-like protein [Cylindrobasidium torrendii FP15055 ss-10]|uniref:WD40 repeat-like protein n=1 Tax=Cylindrobasidium torrendii FP15055 ss-10 TaxID=1314674 RepID=A0A0D7BMZ8_9AGAR|nr:WD40 repeat-like protein [Cylindrobasidium torrendii FP15055 ss-10]
MIQTSVIDHAHNDLVTDAVYNFYGTRLATGSVDQKIKVWQLDEANGGWTLEDEWKAHDAGLSKLSWAHPEFGTILASASFDRTVKVWEQLLSTSNTSAERWVEKAVLHEARGTVRGVEFGPHHFGLKLASISTDNHLRVYECLEPTTWQLAEEIDVQGMHSTQQQSRAYTQAVATPTQTGSSSEGPSAPLVTQALLQQLPRTTGNREADGGWALSWCKDHFWGELIACSTGVTPEVRIIQLSASKRPETILTLSPGPDAEGAVTSVAWAPSCGRSYHLVATGSRDGRVRVWRLKPGDDSDAGDMDQDGEDDGQWEARIVADFDQHQSAVGRVEWNVTGTVLSSAGNDGKIRLWKATSGGSIWRPAGSIGVEETEPTEQDKDVQDVDMA